MCVVFFLAGLTLISQTFEGKVSLSIQQSNSAPSLLTGLGLGGSTTKKYVGVLKSRWVASQVESAAHIRDLYNLPNEDEAIHMLTRSVVVDDKPADGLLYIHVSLPGPPILFGSSERRKRVRAAAQTASNAYADALRAYVINLDNDRELVLLRAAKQQLLRARTDYDRAVNRLATFVKSSPIAAAQMQASATSDAKSPSTSDERTSVASATVLQQLYAQKGITEVELRSLDAVTGARESLVNKQVDAASRLPAEDPLLAQARLGVIAARQDLQNLEIQYGPDNPRVLVARDRLTKLENRLKEEGNSIRRGLTSEHVEAEVQRSNLNTKLATLSAQIAEAEKKFQIGREKSTDFDMLRGEVTLRLEVLKQTASQAAVLNLQTVSAQSRVAVIDRSEVPKKGSPGTILIAVGSLFLSGLVLLAWLSIDYIREVARLSGATPAASTA